MADLVTPLAHEYHSAGKGNEITVSNRYYPLFDNPDRPSVKTKFSLQARLFSVARRGDFEFVFAHEPAGNKVIAGWFTRRFIRKRAALTPLDQLLPGLAKKVADLSTKSQNELYRLTVVTEPKHARVRIMNIVPSYYDGIRLKKDQYEIRVDADGYRPESRTIRLLEDRRIEISLRSLNASKAHIAGKRTAVQRESLVVQDEGKGILRPASKTAIPMHKRTDTSRGVKSAGAEFMSAYGYAVKLNKRFDLYSSIHSMSSRTIGFVDKNQLVIRLDRQAPPQDSYVMFKDASGRVRFAWIKDNLHQLRNAIPFNTMHESYFESFLDGYFRAVKPVRMYMRQHRYTFPNDSTRWNWRFHEGTPVDVYMQHPQWNDALVRHNGDKSGTVYRWIDKSLLFSQAQHSAKVAANKKTIGEFKAGVGLFFLAFVSYIFIMLGTEWGRHQLASLSYVLLSDRFRGYTLFGCGVSVVTLFFLFATLRGMDPKNLTESWEDIGHSYMWFLTPLIIVAPIFLYMAKVYLDTRVSHAQIQQSSEYTHNRSRATYQNQTIHDEIGQVDRAMDGIRAKAEITRMERVRDAMKKRKEAYDGFIDSAKSQRAAEVEASYKEREDG